MGYEPIDSNESYQVDQNGKIIDSILRSVEPEVDDKGPFINTNKSKKYVADLIKKLHGKKEADEYLAKYKARQEAIAKSNAPDEEEEKGEPAPEKEGDGTKGDEDEASEGESEPLNLSSNEKIAAVQEFFEENKNATYSEVKEGLAEEGVKVNDQHVSKGKEAAGLK